MTNTETAPHQRKKSPDELRREHQRALAIRLVANGVATTPTVNKSTVIKEWPRLDTSIPLEEKNSIHAKAIAEGKRRPLHIGSTRKVAVVKKLWSAWQDANPCIPCGVNGLIAIDVDIKRNKSTGEIRYHGPLLFEAFCKEKGIIIGPDVPKTISQSGAGFHLIYRNPLGLGSRAGGFDELGCDIRGGNADGTEGGGQIVAPGAWRTDGKRYESAEGHVDFITAFAEGTIPDLPEAFVKLIGTEGAQRSGESNSVSEREVKAHSVELQKTELPDAATLLDPVLDGYDMPTIERRYPAFREAIDNGNRSGIIFGLAGALKAERASATAAEYAAILFTREDCGDFVHNNAAESGVSFNWRSISRSWLRSVPLTSEKSTGEAFDAPAEDDETEDDTDLSDETMREREKEKKKRLQRAEREAKERKAEADEPEEDVTEGVKPPQTPTAPKDKGILRSMSLHNNFTPAPEVIENLLPAVGLVCLYADSNIGKTFLAIEMLDRVMRGQKFFGLNTKQGDVLLVAGEGREGLKKRMTALHKERPYDGDGIAVSFDLPTFEDAPTIAAGKLKKKIKECEAQSGKKMRLVVLDNLIAMAGGGDLNAANEVTPLLKALEDLANELGICILIIHHENRSGSQAGSYAIRARFDNMLQITEDKHGIRTLRKDKLRDGPKDGKLQFRLKYIPLGENEWGNPIGSCVVEPCGSPDEKDAMGAVIDDDADAPTLRQLDRREDRVQAVVDTFERAARLQKADDEPLSATLKRIQLQSGEIVESLAARRKASEMTELGRSTIRDYINAAVAEGLLHSVGTNGRPAYTLA